ncbi:MAG: peptidylprolyl isomerase [Candidatus Competibacterales bacterium]
MLNALARSLCCAALGTALAAASAASPQGGKPLATVAGEPITYGDLVAYSQRWVDTKVYLTIPGGLEKILQRVIDDRLLHLEGERLGVAIPPANQGGEAGFLAQVERRIAKPCPPVTEDQVQAFYRDNLHRFSTPLLLRIQRIGLPADETNRLEVHRRLADLKDRIETGEVTFAAAAEEYSEDPMSQGRAGDIGFIPVERDPNPVVTQLKGLDPASGTVVGPVAQPGMSFIYRVTDRREPIPAAFEEVAQEARAGAAYQCRRRALDAALAQLQTRWPVEIHPSALEALERRP